MALELFASGRLSVVVSGCNGVDSQVHMIILIAYLCLCEFFSMHFEVVLCTVGFMCDAKVAVDWDSAMSAD